MESTMPPTMDPLRHLPIPLPVPLRFLILYRFRFRLLDTPDVTQSAEPDLQAFLSYQIQTWKKEGWQKYISESAG
jgi:hypothetical protein